jgi:glucose/arabinose dehydrogenase
MIRSILGTIAISCVLAGTSHAIDITPAFPSLANFDSPINIEHPGDGTDRLFVVERAGQIYVFANNPNVSTRSVFLDISSLLITDGECGLLGLAFHPNYESNRHFYVFYVDGSPRQTVIARFTANAGNPNIADPGSHLPLLTIAQNGFFHKGGCIEFGPDGYLYISLGEDNDTVAAQALTSLKGKVLRIDVDNPEAPLQYGIPDDNPFEGNQSGYREEIYAYGFRNPWRFSFDFDTGDLWLGDVGQNTWEEIDRVRKGRNYGWPEMEGNACYPIGQPCDTTNLDIVLPVAVYNHGGSGASVTGGCVYRGPSVPSLYGDYIFADYIDGQLWWIDPDNNPSVLHLIDDTTLNIAAFGTDDDGELYFSTFNGPIYRFVETTTDVPAHTPALGALRAARPNPFHGSSTMEYSLAESGHATLEVFDVQGRRVATLIDRLVPAGDHTAAWNGRGVDGRALPSGVYFSRLTVNGSPVGTQRIVMVK